jgi:tRNA (mo5U34)-methyltransferase
MREQIDADLLERVAARPWYHTIELSHGVITPGWFDCRRVADEVLPGSLDGARCLDIGAFDGFWGFQMERRGAASVTAIDILDESRWDWPGGDTSKARHAIATRKGGGDGFLLAREALGSSVERLDASVHDLDPELHGSFDFIYLGSLLLHLRDPIGALMRVREVCRGTLVSVDAVHGRISGLAMRRPAATLDGIGRPYWWMPNLRGHGRMVEAAGFVVTDGPNRFRMPAGDGHPRPPLRSGPLLAERPRSLLIDSRLGNPHAWLHAKPLPR